MKNVIKKSGDYLRAGFAPFAKKAVRKVCHTDFIRYHSYLMREKNESSDTLAGYAEGLPLISVVVPVYKTNLAFLKALIKSVTDSEYENWELCLADGSESESHSSEIKDICRQFQDSRIHLKVLNKNLGIAGNTNAAIDMAKGDWIVFMDHDDTITVDALGAVAAAALNNPHAEIIYSDEDKIKACGGPGYDPHLKTEYDPILLDSVNYISHLTAVKRTLISRIGKLNSEYDGAQDYDFILRATEEAEAVVHIPSVLYHWRSCSGSTAKGLGEKSYADTAGERALAAHVKRVYGEGIDIEAGFSAGNYRLKFPVPVNAGLTVVLWTTGNVMALKGKSEELSRKLSGNINIVETGFADILKTARKAENDYVLFLSEDADIKQDDVNRLLGYVSCGYVDACGPTLVDNRGVIVSSGQIKSENGYPFDAFCGYPLSEPGYMGKALMMRSVSSLPINCLMMPKKLVPDFKKVSTPELLGAKICRFLEHLSKRIACVSFVHVTLNKTRGSLCKTYLKKTALVNGDRDAFYHEAFISKSPGYLIEP